MHPTPSFFGIFRRYEPFAFSALTFLSMEFSFSVSGDGGNVSNYVGVEFDTSKDDNVLAVVTLAWLLLSTRKSVFHFHFISIFSPKTSLYFPFKCRPTT